VVHCAFVRFTVFVAHWIRFCLTRSAHTPSHDFCRLPRFTFTFSVTDFGSFGLPGCYPGYRLVYVAGRFVPGYCVQLPFHYVVLIPCALCRLLLCCYVSRTRYYVCPYRLNFPRFGSPAMVPIVLPCALR